MVIVVQCKIERAHFHQYNSNDCAPGSVAAGTHARIPAGLYEHVRAAVSRQELKATGMLNVAYKNIV